MLRESLSPLESSMRQMGELLDAEQEEITFLLNELGKMSSGSVDEGELG